MLQWLAAGSLPSACNPKWEQFALPAASSLPSSWAALAPRSAKNAKFARGTAACSDDFLRPPAIERSFCTGRRRSCRDRCARRGSLVTFTTTEVILPATAARPRPCGAAGVVSRSQTSPMASTCVTGPAKAIEETEQLGAKASRRPGSRPSAAAGGAACRQCVLVSLVAAHEPYSAHESLFSC